MVTIECPWCEQSLEVDAVAESLVMRCSECAVVVDIAQDDAALLAAAA
jgi:hypothetical protein